MSTKRLTKKQREERDIAAIETVLRDLALGANGGYAVDDNEGSIAYGMDTANFGWFLTAVGNRFEVGREAVAEGSDWRKLTALDYSHFGRMESFEDFASHLYECGVRER